MFMIGHMLRTPPLLCEHARSRIKKHWVDFERLDNHCRRFAERDRCCWGQQRQMTWVTSLGLWNLLRCPGLWSVVEGMVSHSLPYSSSLGVKGKGIINVSNRLCQEGIEK